MKWVWEQSKETMALTRDVLVRLITGVAVKVWVLGLEVVQTQ